MNDTAKNVDSKIDAEGRYLCFSLGKEKFAIPLLQVKEVVGDTDMTSIPQSPPYFKGIMNLRGQIISVVDLKLKLKVGKPEKNNQATIIILDLGSLSLAVLVDSVDSVVVYSKGDISRSPDANSSIGANFIVGVARKENSLTLILDIEAILNVGDLNTVKLQSQKAAA